MNADACFADIRSYQRLVGRQPYRYWRVRCNCGFWVADLSSEEAADDTRRWHLGESSLLGTVERLRQERTNGGES